MSASDWLIIFALVIVCGFAFLFAANVVKSDNGPRWLWEGLGVLSLLAIAVGISGGLASFGVVLT